MRSYNDVPRSWARFNEHGIGKGHRTDKDRISYSESVLISWQTAVAKYHKNSRGELYALVASRQYSVSSSSHISNAAAAVHVTKFRVPAIGAPGGWNHDDWYNMEQVHAFNLVHMQAEFIDACKDCEMAFHQDAPVELRSSNRHWGLTDGQWQEKLRQLDAGMWAYAEVTESSLPVDRRPIGEIIADVADRRKARYDKFYNPKAVAARARSRARRLAINALDLDHGKR